MRTFILFLTALGVAQVPLRAQLPTITNQPASVAVWAGYNVTFAVGVSNAGSFTYEWQFNSTNLTNGIITTVAGGSVGDGGAATNASLYAPTGVALDASGDLFIADYSNNRIRRVGTNGIITTVAGSGTYAYSGDGGAATNAGLRYPYGVALDASGNLFIADEGDDCIRRVGTNGIITTVAGNGTYGYSGDGGAATNASLCDPTGVTLDASGNLFIADTSNQRIRRVGTNGIITTVAGNGTNGYSGDGGAATNAELYYPGGVALDASGNLFIGDASNQRIRKVSTNGIITTVAGNGTYGYFGDGGAATNAELYWPSGVALDASGNLFIADQYNNRIRKVGTNGIITTVAGNGTTVYSGDGGMATNAGLNWPYGVALDASGNLFIADQYNSRIRKVSTNGIITTVAGGGVRDGGMATDAGLYRPDDVAVDASGNLFIADEGNSRIRKVSTNGIITTVVGNGTPAYAGDGGAATNAELCYPECVAVNAFGCLFIADSGNYRIRKVDTNGVIMTVAGNGAWGYSGDGGAATNASLDSPYGVEVDASGNLFIADEGDGRIRKVSTNGIITTVAGNGTNGYSGDGGAATNASLYAPAGVALDASGNLFIADYFNDRIRKVSTNGIITTVAGNGTGGYSGDGGAATNAELNYPRGVALDAFGNLFIADAINQRIRKVSTNGIITTVAGNGTYGFYSGDGGPATNAGLRSPSGVAVDAFGNLFIADAGNNCIRKVTDTQGPVLALNNASAANAGSYQVVVTGPGGSVTSSVANLTVAASPLIYKTVRNSGGSMTLNFVSQPGSTNEVLCATNLSPPVLWQPISTNMAGLDGDWQFTDTNAAGYRERFYRSLMQ
jgi:sugar lactone lactonase YvrE